MFLCTVRVRSRLEQFTEKTVLDSYMTYCCISATSLSLIILSRCGWLHYNKFTENLLLCFFTVLVKENWVYYGSPLRYTSNHHPTKTKWPLSLERLYIFSWLIFITIGNSVCLPFSTLKALKHRLTDITSHTGKEKYHTQK